MGVKIKGNIKEKLCFCTLSWEHVNLLKLCISTTLGLYYLFKANMCLTATGNNTGFSSKEHMQDNCHSCHNGRFNVLEI